VAAGTTDRVKRILHEKLGYASAALLAGGIASYFIGFVAGGGYWVEGSRPPVGPALNLLGACLVGLCLPLSIAGSVLSKRVLQRLLSVACTLVTAYPVYYVVSGVLSPG
jgi:hypothetical protein